MSKERNQANQSTQQRPLRLWPGVVIVALLFLARFVIPVFEPEVTPYGAMGGLVAGIAMIVWWGFFSRASRTERWGAIGLMAIALAVTPFLVHESIATGAMGMLYYLLAVPFLCFAFVGWAVVSRYLAAGPRRATMIVTILLACGIWTLFRTGGFTGDFDNDLKWRWRQTAEERLLTQSGDELKAVPEEPVPIEAEADWPGFRGSRRDGVIRSVQIESDWSVAPPVQLWRRPVGPAWSSFAVQDDFFFTQEQRGEEEVVACYNMTTGAPVWGHRDETRFWESNAGAGPRATPTLKDGRVYTFGATGILNALDASDGAVIWSRDAAADTDTEVPAWGFASSPLVVGDVVIIAAEGTLAAYDRDTGEPRWIGPDGGSGYSSPHLLTLDGVPQVLLMSGAGATSVSPADGMVLWQHPLPPRGRIVQPALTADGDLLLSDGEKNGMRRISVAQGPDGWQVDELWLSNGLKPYFNDFVVHGGYAFGFDGSILACIDVTDGKRQWKGGRYGHGQMVLLADQNLLLVLSESGELALVQAAPDQFTELARFPAIEGKTWNHPVLVGDVLLVRNAQEMAAFRLSLAAGSVSKR